LTDKKAETTTPQQVQDAKDSKKALAQINPVHPTGLEPPPKD
jgi:hypothetical protein